jgi:hypothetical protein
MADAGRLNGLKVAVSNTMDRLKLAADPTKAVAGLPAGSDQFDSGSIITWLNKIGPADRRAVRQVIAIDATLRSRLGG